VHPFDAQGNAFGSEVRGLAVTPEGDLWMADKKALYFMPMLSSGPDAWLTGQPIGLPGKLDGSVLDVWPDVNDAIWGIGLDKAGGIYVASYGNGLAYLAPGTYAKRFWTAADKLPSNDLTALEVDVDGDVWVGTHNTGVVRYSPSSNSFTYYTTHTGLPSDVIRQIQVDRYGSGKRTVYISTNMGVAVYTGP